VSTDASEDRDRDRNPDPDADPGASLDPDAAALAAPLGAAAFVRVAAAADGDALAAAGLVANGLAAAGVPFQVRVRDDPTPASTAAADDDAVVLAVGTRGGDHAIATRPVSAVAFEIARTLGGSPDPLVALAGGVAAGDRPDGVTEVALQAAGDRVERRPGLGVPVADLGDGLAHSTLLAGPLSGDPEAARALLAELSLPADLDDDARRRLASLVAVDVATDEGATPAAAEAVGRALRPHATADGQFATVEGFADVLDAVARERPGVGVALALGETPSGLRAAALDAWRDHAVAAHEALRGATTTRHSGLFVLSVDVERATARLPTVARLCRDFRSPEPLVLAVADVRTADVDGTAGSDSDAGADGTAARSDDDRPPVDEPEHRHVAALAARDDPDTSDDPDAGTLAREAAAAVHGPAVGYGSPRRGGALFDAPPDAFVEAVREVAA
jgi:hypothetical protein